MSGYLCLSLRITSIFGKSFIDLDSAKGGFISTNTEEHIKGSEPQRSIVAVGSALLWCPLGLECPEAKGAHVKSRNYINSVDFFEVISPQFNSS